MDTINELADKALQIPAVAIAVQYASGIGARVAERIDTACVGLPPWVVVLYTAIGCYIAGRVLNFLFQDESLYSRVKKSLFRCLRATPFIGSKIEGELNKTLDKMSDEVFPTFPGETFVYKLPENGNSFDTVLAECKRLQDMGEVDWKAGHVSGTVYHGGDALAEFATKVYGMFAWSNPLHLDVFPGARKMEAEVVAMCIDMFKGDDKCCGAMTTGGTESILMAMRAYREWGRARGITKPNAVLPESMHCAFDKAADYFGIHLIKIPVDRVTRRVNPRAVARAINRNTVMIGGSAPNYPDGVIDPLEELAAVASRAGIGMHMDCCLGGFLVPFMEEAGFDVPKHGFAVPGITSISCDTHKYGFAPKGSSVIMYSSRKLRAHQFFVAPDWPGGIYASPSIPGSRAGALVAATWAVMMHHGRKGYVESTRKIINSTRFIEAAVREIDHVRVLGTADVSVVAIASDDFEIYRLSSAMSKLGWNLSPLQFPSAIHLCVTLVHTAPGVSEKFVDDLRNCVAEIMKDPDAKAGGMGAIYGMAQAIPDRSLVQDIARGFLDIALRVEPSVRPPPDNSQF